MKDKITILVNSCDKYEDAWFPFFKLFEKFSGKLKECDIVLNTESKSFNYEGLNIICPQMYLFGEDVAWGKRLRDTLNTIKTEFVFVVLEDFFVRRPIDVEVFERCLQYFEANKSIGAFNLEPLDGAVNESHCYKDFCIIPHDVIYRFNAQACIWRKETLFNSVLDIESPWDWELYGNIRNSIVLKDTEIYALKLGINEPYFYDFYRFGQYSRDNRIIITSSITRGKWVKESVEKLFKDNDIAIDYAIRGEYVKPKEDKFKNTLFYRVLFYLAKPFRKKVLEQSRIETEKRKKEIMEKFVNPYLNINE